jgi:hypothetical protein
VSIFVNVPTTTNSDACFEWMVSPRGMRIYFSSGTSVSVSNGTIFDGNWHTLALTVTDTAITFYKDGIYYGAASGVSSSTVLLCSGVALVGGLPNGTRVMTGEVDNINLYTSILSNDLISAEKCYGTTLVCPMEAVTLLEPMFINKNRFLFSPVASLSSAPTSGRAMFSFPQSSSLWVLTSCR